MKLETVIFLLDREFAPTETQSLETYFPDSVVRAFGSVGVFAFVLSVHLKVQAI